MGTGRYILDGHAPVPCEDLMQWGRWLEGADTRVASDSRGGVTVSTVFLGLDHRFGPGPPLIFETMAFPADGSDEECERYSTWDEAVAGHEAMCAKVLGEKR